MKQTQTRSSTDVKYTRESREYAEADLLNKIERQLARREKQDRQRRIAKRIKAGLILGAVVVLLILIVPQILKLVSAPAPRSPSPTSPTTKSWM